MVLTPARLVSELPRAVARRADFQRARWRKFLTRSARRHQEPGACFRMGGGRAARQATEPGARGRGRASGSLQKRRSEAALLGLEAVSTSRERAAQLPTSLPAPPPSTVRSEELSYRARSRSLERDPALSTWAQVRSAELASPTRSHRAHFAEEAVQSRTWPCSMVTMVVREGPLASEAASEAPRALKPKAARCSALDEMAQARRVAL